MTARQVLGQVPVWANCGNVEMIVQNGLAWTVGLITHIVLSCRQDTLPAFVYHAENRSVSSGWAIPA